MRRRISWPLGLTAIRLVLGPAMLWYCYRGRASAPWLVVCFYVAVASDVFDGIVARRLEVATPGQRRFDSQADLVFWLWLSVRCGS